MDFFKKIWVRIISSLLLGGLIQEGVHIKTGDPNRLQTSNFSLLYALIVFLIFTIMIRIADRYYKEDNDLDLNKKN
jgi:hypothetical protein